MMLEDDSKVPAYVREVISRIDLWLYWKITLPTKDYVESSKIDADNMIIKEIMNKGIVLYEQSR